RRSIIGGKTNVSILASDTWMAAATVPRWSLGPTAEAPAPSSSSRKGGRGDSSPETLVDPARPGRGRPSRACLQFRYPARVDLQPVREIRLPQAARDSPLREPLRERVRARFVKVGSLRHVELRFFLEASPMKWIPIHSYHAPAVLSTPAPQDER